MKTFAVIHARLSSSRLKHKVIKNFCGNPMISFQIQRLKKSKLVDRIIVATTNKKEDDKINYAGNDHCSLAAHFRLNPGETKKVRFVISWYYPVVTNYWNPQKNNMSCPNDADNDCGTSNSWLNYYARLFNCSKD